MLKYTIASLNGPFGQHFLARHLANAGQLVRWYDSRPFSRSKRKFNWISKSYYRSIDLLEYVRHFRMLFLKNLFVLSNNYFQALESSIFAKWVSMHKQLADIEILFSGCALNSLRRAKNPNSLRILFNNSTHISNALEILRQESLRQGFAIDLPPPWWEARILEEYERADYIRVPAEFARQTFLDRGFPPEKIKVIPHGYELDIFKPGPKTDNVFRVLFFGAVGFRKGIPMLFEAFENAAIPNSELLLVGGVSNDIQPFLNASRVPFKSLGYKSWSELPPIISQASVSVLLSLEEGSAGTIGQAMACGIPVIASKSSGCEPIIRNGTDGYVIHSAHDSEEVAKKLRFLSDNPNILREMSCNCIKRASEFSWNNHCLQATQWFQELHYNSVRIN